jgi:PAS domain S-box-containing protein
MTARSARASDPTTPSKSEATAARSAALYEAQLNRIFRSRDRVFAWLFVAQWAFALFVALVWSPYGWQGKIRTTHLHVYYAVFFGALLTLPSLFLIKTRPGSPLTRHAVAVVQMLWSALLIHLSGGRIETHFHIFGSLAFLAFYRDWKVILTATVVVAGEHLTRGLLWPESVYGIVNPEWWRFLEHAGWVVFEDVVLVMGVVEGLRALHLLSDRQAELEAVNDTVERKVIERTNELSTSREQYRLLVETTKTIPCEIDAASHCFRYVGPQVQDMLGFAPADCLTSEFLADHLHPDDRERVVSGFSGLQSTQDGQLEFRLRRADGTYMWARLFASALDDDPAHGRLLRGIALDITQTRELEIQLRQAQKLESVGRLASGVAHEINTPVQFVNDSVHFVRDAFADLAALIAEYQSLRACVREGCPGTPASEMAEKVARAEEDADLSYVLESVPQALGRSIDGLGRIAEIVRSMKEFAHPDRKEMTTVDLNHAIQSTLIIARNEYKFVADLATFLGDLPPVTCYASEMNQVILNIVVNAAHAIEDVVKGTDRKGVITVRSIVDGDSVVISVSDTGTGIPEHIRDRIFDPFFTTKQVGKGTGQGLAIARSVVVDKHGGDLNVESEVGKGTTFLIRLPVSGKRPGAAEMAA